MGTGYFFMHSFLWRF